MLSEEDRCSMPSPSTVAWPSGRPADPLICMQMLYAEGEEISGGFLRNFARDVFGVDGFDAQHQVNAMLAYGQKLAEWFGSIQQRQAAEYVAKLKSSLNPPSGSSAGSTAEGC